MKWRLITLCLVPCVLAQGQENDTLRHSYYIGVKAQGGFIIPHSTEIINVSGSRPVGLQFDVSRINRTVRAWNKCNCYSLVGLSLLYVNYQNPEVLGSSYNLGAYMEPLLTYKPRLNFRFRTGAGLTYLTDVYHATDNPTNLFFSSSLSGFLMVGFSAHYRIGSHWNANLGLHYNHISNGGLQQPNKGMNFPTLNFGMEYQSQSRRHQAATTQSRGRPQGSCICRWLRELAHSTVIGCGTHCEQVATWSVRRHHQEIHHHQRVVGGG